MTNIIFDTEGQQTSSHWDWHHGRVEHEGKEYPFSVLEMADGISGMAAFELTWCEDTPPNANELKEQILQQVVSV